MQASEIQIMTDNTLPMFPSLVGTTFDPNASLRLTSLKPRKQNVLRKEKTPPYCPNCHGDATAEPELPITQTEVSPNDNSFSTPISSQSRHRTFVPTSADFPSFPALPSLVASDAASGNYMAPRVTLAPRFRPSRLVSPRGVVAVEQTVFE